MATETFVDVTGNNTSIHITASITFPLGFDVEVKASDADALDFPDLDTAQAEMTPNGTMVVWRPPVPTQVTIPATPNTEEAKNLEILFNANRSGANKLAASDNITMVITYPDGSKIKLLDGVTMGFTPGKGIAQDGRLKTKSFRFNFGGMQ